MNPPKLTDALTDVGPGTSSAVDTRFFGHPRGLATLFFTEMWERFSYYGMRAFLLFYMVTPVANGGLGFTDAQGTSLYGTYTGSAWGAAIVGGLIADRLIGQYPQRALRRHPHHARAPLAGVPRAAVLLHRPRAHRDRHRAAEAEREHARRLAVSAGRSQTRRRLLDLLHGDQLRRMLGPIIAGYVAQRIDWHLGFGCAAIGMALGLVQYVLDKRHLQPRSCAWPKRRRIRAAGIPSHSTSAPSARAASWASRPVNGVASPPSSCCSSSRSCSGLATKRPALTRAFRRPQHRPSPARIRVSLVVVPGCPTVLRDRARAVFAWLWIRLGSREPSVR